MRPSTFDSYARNVELHVVRHIGPTSLQKLSPGHLNSLYAKLLIEGRADGRGGLSRASVRYVHAILHRALGDAVKWALIVRNPCEAAEPPRPDRSQTRMRVWTASELRRFIAFTEDDRLHAAWVLASTTGMRRGEVLGLRWADVDLTEARLSVRQTLVSVAYEVRVSAPKTKKARRSIALDALTVRALRAHRVRQAEERLALGDGYEDGDLVFAEPDGRHIHPDGFGKAFKRHAIDAGLPVIRLHDLRHTHATLALQAGIHPKVVSERLGHSTVSMTLDTYSEVLPALQHEAAERVAELLFAEE